MKSDHEASQGSDDNNTQTSVTPRSHWLIFYSLAFVTTGFYLVASPIIDDPLVKSLTYAIAFSAITVESSCGNKGESPWSATREWLAPFWPMRFIVG
ncbi:MAG: hypothetical protein R3C05_29720 [Pirellulaceae bacterium]